MNLWILDIIVAFRKSHFYEIIISDQIELNITGSYFATDFGFVLICFYLSNDKSLVS